MSNTPIVPSSEDWPEQFAIERDRLAAVLGPRALRIEHHGSTSVAGLAAKPIIDIQISVASLQPLPVYVDALARLGYVHVPHPDDDRCPFFHRPAEWPHTHHVHLVVAGSEEESDTLIFRDALRACADARSEYEALKRHIATQWDASTFEGREAYAAAKTAFVQRIIRDARARSSR